MSDQTYFEEWRWLCFRPTLEIKFARPRKLRIYKLGLWVSDLGHVGSRLVVAVVVVVEVVEVVVDVVEVVVVVAAGVVVVVVVIVSKKCHDFTEPSGEELLSESAKGNCVSVSLP